MQTENPCANIYTIKDFERLNKYAEAHILSDKTIEVINMLANMVGAPSYSRTPNFTSDNKRRVPGHNKHRRRDKKNTEISDEDWEAIRNFKATQYSKAEGLNESLNAIRIEINKITNNTYTTQMEIINNKPLFICLRLTRQLPRLRKALRKCKLFVSKDNLCRNKKLK